MVETRCFSMKPSSNLSAAMDLPLLSVDAKPMNGESLDGIEQSIFNICQPILRSRHDNNCEKKEVRFADAVAEVVVIVETPCPEERQMRWYTAEDLSLVRKATRWTIKELEKHGGDASELDSEIHCLRGLDRQLCYRDRTRQKQRRDIQRNFVLGVLEQQYCQHLQGISDSGGLGMFARACSKWSRERAVAQAAEDAHDALRACTDEKDFCSSILCDALDLVEREDEDLRCSGEEATSMPNKV